MISPIDEIKNKLDIVEVIGQYVKLEKSGANYRALCPFHKEKTPSFFVSPSRQIWHCFGACNEGGDIFKFIMKIENVDFKEAVRILAEKAGVKLTFEKPEVRSLKQRLLSINKLAAYFFQVQLQNNKEALEYLKKRGLKKETIEEFQLGFAPDQWRSLTEFLFKKGYSLKELLLSGLILSKKEVPAVNNSQFYKEAKINDFYDRFRSRIMFPIENSRGEIIGFTGRIFQGSPLKTIKDVEKVGKYVNSPQTLIFDKSKILYGFSQSKEFILKNQEAFIVEGQMDFLMAYQEGIKNIVATSGTSLTPYHLNFLKKYASTLVLGFDMDEAGQKAIEKVIEMAFKNNFQLKVLDLGQEKDLADFLLREKDYQKVLSRVEGIMDFYFQRAKSMGDNQTLEGKKRIASYFLFKIKKLPNALDRAHWLEALADYLNLSSRILEDELKKIEKLPETEFQGAKDENETIILEEEVNRSRRDILSERILSLFLNQSSKIEELKKYKEYFSKEYLPIIDIFESVSSKEDLSSENLKKMNVKEEIIDTINRLFLRADYENEILKNFKIDWRQELTNNLKELKKETLKEKLALIEIEIKKAEQEKDEKRLKDLLKDFNQLTKELVAVNKD